MTTDSTDSTNEDPHGGLTIRIPEGELPNDQEQRRRLEETLGDRLADLLEVHYSLDVDVPTVQQGHHFAELPMDCPWCDEDLHFSPVSLDPPSGAIAPVECQNDDCSLSARGIFRLVDLRWNDLGTDRSAVAESDIEPRYNDYKTQNL